jgi:hypothetical protein
VQDALRVGGLVDDVEVQAVALVGPLVGGAGVQAGVERRVVELALVTQRRELRRAVGIVIRGTKSR